VVPTVDIDPGEDHHRLGGAVIVGIPLAYGFVQLLGAVLLNAPFVFNPIRMLAMLVFIVAVASVATIGPVWTASRVRIADTLRYE